VPCPALVVSHRDGGLAALRLPLVVLAWLFVGVASAQVPAYWATFVSQNVPPVLEIQAPARVTITMRNAGTAMWRQTDGDVFLATQRPQDNYYWCIQDNRYGGRSGNRALLPKDVAPGEDVTFDFIVKPLGCVFAAPSPLRFRMLSHRFGTFGEETPDPNVDVTTAAEFVAQEVPLRVPAGAAISPTVTFKNTTNTTWTRAAGYALGSTDPTGNTRWGLRSIPLPVDVAPGESVRFVLHLTAPGIAGTHNLQWQMTAPDGTPFGAKSPPTAVAVVAAGLPNYQGLWWGSPAGSESGWGMNVAHQDEVIFVTWFTYDATGAAWWLSMTASRNFDGSFGGTLLQQTGPSFDAVPFNPAVVRSTAVGTATLTFTDASNGSFAYTLNGISQTKAINRQVFGALPTCTFAIQDSLAAAYNYQDLWWAAPAGSESGWGINLTHQDDVIFATWYTYGANGSPLWLSATAPRTGPGTYAGKLYRTSGPAFDAVPFDPARVVLSEVGDLALKFTDGNTGTFDYTLLGVTQSKRITRQVFRTPGTTCQ
jgi:hypothetical protein